MKSRKETILGKRLVQGDPNLVTKDEILVKEKDNKVYMYQRNNWGRLVSVNHQYPQKEKDYMEVYMAKVKCDTQDKYDGHSKGKMHPIYTINITCSMKYNTKETKYFIFFLPFYKVIETDAVQWKINVQLMKSPTQEGEDYSPEGYGTQVLSGLDFLSTIMKQEDYWGLDPSCYLNPDDVRKSTRVCGLVEVYYESDEEGHSELIETKLLPAFNEKKEITVVLSDGSEQTMTTYVQKFKILNVDKKVRTFYTLPLRKKSNSDEFFEENIGCVQLANPEDSIFRHRKRAVRFKKNGMQGIGAYKEYAVNRFTGQSFVVDSGNRNIEYKLPFDDDYRPRRYITVPPGGFGAL